MGTKRTAVKEVYNKKTYEDIRLRVKIGEKEVIMARAAQKDLSLNAYIVDLIEQDIAKSNRKKDGNS